MSFRRLALKSTSVQVAKNDRKSPGLGVKKPKLRAQTKHLVCFESECPDP